MGQSLREKGWVVVDTWTTVFSEDNGVVHQILSPISNSESTNFLNEY